MKDEKLSTDNVQEIAKEEMEKIQRNDDLESAVEETSITTIKDFGAMQKKSKTKAEVFTNIQDNKKIFNLDSHVDVLLNDCEGEIIQVKEVLIKRFEKPLKEPKVNEETGEIKDKEITMACILIDKENKSYATGSKTFTINMMKYIQMFGIENGVDIKIIKSKVQGPNKALNFELV